MRQRVAGLACKLHSQELLEWTLQFLRKQQAQLADHEPSPLSTESVSAGVW